MRFKLKPAIAIILGMLTLALNVSAQGNTMSDASGVNKTSQSNVEIDKGNPMSTDLKQRGEKLRAEIESTFKTLKNSHALKPSGQGRNFITDIVANYIPIGTSFSDAKAILLAAGCQLSTFPIEISKANPTLDGVFGKLHLSSDFPSGSDFAIDLKPKTPGDYSGEVFEMSAEIVVTSM